MMRPDEQQRYMPGFVGSHQHAAQIAHVCSSTATGRSHQHTPRGRPPGLRVRRCLYAQPAGGLAVGGSVQARSLARRTFVGLGLAALFALAVVIAVFALCKQPVRESGRQHGRA